MAEAYNQAQYANLAGQANGALNTIGGKLKGFFNPDWKKRKERQERSFANAATDDTYGNSHIMDNLGIETTSANNNDSYYNTDKYVHDFRKGETDPFGFRRVQGNYNPENNEWTRGKQSGERITTNNFGYQHNTASVGPGSNNYIGSGDFDHNAAALKTSRTLNNQYNTGRRAAMGKIKPDATNLGGQPIGGTGTNNAAFRRAGEGNYKD